MDECRDLADKAVTDGEQRVSCPGFAERHVLLADADNDAADNVDEGDQKAGYGIAAHEFRGTVHGAEEGGLVFQPLAAGAGGFFVDQAGRKVGVDRHLLAGHGIQGEARSDFRDTARTLGDDNEVHDHQNGKDDDADDEIALHHEIAESLDHFTCGVRAFMALRKDETGRSEVERQADHRGDEKHSRKSAELKRRADEERGHQHQHREGDGDGER